MGDRLFEGLAPGGGQVREWEFDEEKQAAEEESNATLETDAADKKKRLEQWSVSAYGEVRPCSLAPLPAVRVRV